MYYKNHIYIFGLVKKFIAIGFLTVYFFSAPDAQQVLKLPFVFKHFAAHRLENSNLSFMDFLAMHYLHGSPKDKDYNEDMKLPFKTTDKYVINFSPVLIPASIRILAVKSIELSIIFVINHPTDFIPSVYLSAIWQPPKSC